MENFATELLKEIKVSAKRWFVAFCVMTALEVLTIIGFMWYISLPAEEVSTTEQSVDDIDGSEVTQIGGDYDGESDTD